MKLQHSLRNAAFASAKVSQLLTFASAKVKSQKNSSGFTLIEVLVTTAIIGVLFIMASSIFINTIRSANKANATNEAKENASLVIEALNRDVRNATGANACSNCNSLTLNPGPITWQCVPAVVGTSNGFITRNGLPVTNRDLVNGVSARDTSNPTTCDIFNVTGASTILVTIDFIFTQGTTQGSSQDLQALVRHKVSFSNRAN